MSCQRQQGVALITAVLVVALVTTIAVAMASQQQLDIRRSANLFNSDQAYLAVLGGEDYARNLLEADRKDNQTDHLEEDWAQPVLFPFEDMVLSGQIEDAQGKFNINNLLDANGEASAEDIANFERLLGMLQLDGAIAQATVDWLDNDINPRPNGGAEDDLYMLKAPPYRAANRLMVSASEMLLVEGMDYESYQILSPFITTLPVRSKVNVNTASAEVLSAMVASTTAADGEALIEARGEDGFATLADFTGQALLNGRNFNHDNLDVSSNYFLLNATAEFDEARSQLFSLLYRDDKGSDVVMRGRGAY